ncbi:MAG: immune inhibitor A [Candidatus Eisenbacteria bacterium]|nr:immune inhibitor A [Candidatus Eisenbacteria bacterium]
MIENRTHASTRPSALRRVLLACLILLASVLRSAAEEHDVGRIDGQPAPPQARRVDPARAGVAERPDRITADARRLGLALVPPRHAIALPIEHARAAEAPVDASRDVLRDHPSLALVDPSSLQAVAVRQASAVTFVHFEQQRSGVPIVGSRVTLAWHAAGRLALVDAATYSESAPIEWGSIGAEQAALFALADLPWGIRPEPVSVTSAYWPIVRGTELALRAAHRVHFRTEDPPGDWWAVVDARDGTVLSRRNVAADLEVRGRVLADIEPATAGDPVTRAGLPLLNLTLGIGAGTRTTRTDEAGRFRFFDLPAGRYLRRAELRGAGIWVRDAANALRTPSDTLTVVAGDSTDVVWNVTNSSFSQRDAYHHATIAYRWIRALDPGSALDTLDLGLELRVDDSSGHCNAYWRGDYFSFMQAGSGCPSTARIADVVYHEYAHAVTQFCFAPFLIPPDLNEGLSDYFAATLTGRPEIGLNFRGPGSFLREIDTDRVWPADQSRDPHLQGLIVAGALWDLRAAVGAEVADRLAHYARYGAAQDMHAYLLDLLLVDDDNGDLLDGSPHFAEIVNAFRAHGLGDYAVRINAAPLTDVEEPAPAIETEALLTSLLGLEADSIGIYYALAPEGPFTRAPAISTDRRQVYRASIPTPPLGTTVWYYWAASDTTGNAARLPALAPTELFRFFVGRDLIAPSLAHKPPEFVTSELDSLRLRLQANDNSGRLSAVSARLEVGGNPPVDAETRYLPPFGLWECVAPSVLLGGVDSLRYRFEATDAAAEPNSSRLPLAGEFVVPVRAGRLLDFESSGGPLTASGDWEWGQPDTVVTAFSGRRLWATGLNRPYGDNLTSDLEWGPIDLSRFDRARIEFRHWYRFESGYDGARIEVSTNDGARWELLTPDGGYSERRIDAFAGPAWSGASADWETVTVPLDPYVGKVVRIRFHAVADRLLNDWGWYLDDVAWIAAQARVRAGSFIARGGENERVALRWTPPVGIDLASPRFLGYRIYRRTPEQPWPTQPLQTAPAGQLEYMDRTVENAVTYEYRVHALYDEGESEGLLRTAVPFAASIGLDLSEVEIHLEGDARTDATIYIRNLSGGNLRFNAFLGESDWELADARAIWSEAEADSSGRTILLEDGRDAGADPDLARVTVVERANPEEGELLEFVLKGWTSWEDPLTGWGGVLLIDADADLGTGTSTDLGWGERVNIGWEYAVYFGKLARDLGSPAAAALFTPGLPDLVPLGTTSFPANADSVSFTLPRNLIGDPERIQASVLLARSREAMPFDRAPESPDVGWLERLPRSGRAQIDHPQPVSLRLDARRGGDGTYRAKLLLETNDLSHPSLTVPLLFTVVGWIPDALESLEFSSFSEGLAIRFQIPEPIVPLFAAVERAEANDPIWGRVGPDTLFADSERTFRWVDSDVQVGRQYLYRFRVIASNAPFRTYGPFEASYQPSTPPTFSLGPPRPNPSGGAFAWQLALPARGDVRLEVFDVRGRRLATQIQSSLRAGFHTISWNGDDDQGNRAPSGIYWMVVEAGGARASSRMVLMRHD